MRVGAGQVDIVRDNKKIIGSGAAMGLVIALLGGWMACTARAQRAVDKGAGQIVVGPNVRLELAPGEAGPVRLAAEDVAEDFEKVMGTRPKIVERQAERPESAGTVTMLVGERAKLPQAMRPGESGRGDSGTGESGAAESFSIAVKKDGQGSAVVLAGADMRGTIYALYQFSQEFLGVDPMYYWTDHEPARRASIEIPAGLDEVFPAPVFKYRGFFLNDEDLLTGWAPGETTDKTGISLAVWSKVYETILRLKGNMVVPGTWIFPDDPQVKLAATRGLILNQHHAIPLGVNVARWPKDVPYNYTTHPEILERAWKDAVAEYEPGQEILWSVGLRGLSDVSYASMDPSVAGNDPALGRLISKAIADQMAIVRAAHPEAKFVTDFWQEGARLVREGYLKIPPEVTPVWADTGYGYLQDDGKVGPGQGMYYHVAMMNNRSNQLTEMVPVGRITEEFGRYIKAGATEYMLVNTSDIRPVTMTTEAVMDFAWKGLPKGEATGQNAAGAGGDAAESQAEAYRREWSAKEFGAKAAPAIAAIYKAYFAAPAHFGQPALEYGDQLYHTESRQMMLTYMTDSPLYSLPSQAPKWEEAHIMGSRPGRPAGKDWLKETAAREIQQCGDAQPRWDAVWQQAKAAEALVPADRRPFYQASVLTMITINRESNRELYLISKAVLDADGGNVDAARKEVAEAKAALDQVAQAQQAAEYGKWKDWYRGDWLTGVYRTRAMVDVFAKFLDDPLTHLSPPILWNGWEAYYHIMHYEGDRSVDVQ